MDFLTAGRPRRHLAGADSCWQLRAPPLLPLHDYNRAAALHLRRLDAEEAAREEAALHGSRTQLPPPSVESPRR